MQQLAEHLYYNETAFECIAKHIMNTNADCEMEDREMTEWKLSQLFKLQAELAAFGSKCVPVWNKALTAEQVKLEVGENKSARLSHVYAEMWYGARNGCVDIVERATKENREHSSWLLDKRFSLRKELEEYGKKILPELAAALEDDCEMLRMTDQYWRESWQQALNMVSDKR